MEIMWTKSTFFFINDFILNSLLETFKKVFSLLDADWLFPWQQGRA